MYINEIHAIKSSFVTMTLPLTHPFTSIVCGPTGCGKTRWIFRLIENVDKMICPSPVKIIYCYGEYQSLFAQHPTVEFQEGLPDVSKFDGSEPVLLIIDDLMNEINSDTEKIFTRMSHHRNISVIFIMQNLFPKNKFARTMSLNAHYMVLFKNPRDAGQFAVLAKQMYPNGSQFAVESYKDATSCPYGYLLLDLKPDTDERFRLRTNIFPEENTNVYIKR